MVFLLWGTTFPVGKMVIDYWSPLLVVAIRFFAAGAFLLGMSCVLRRQVHRISPRALVLIGIVGVLQYYAYYSLSYYALQRIQASDASIIASSYPLIVALMSPSYWREKEELVRRVLGLGLGLAGVAVAVGWSSPLAGLRVGPGELLMLLATLALASGTRLWKSAGQEGSIVEGTAYAMLVGAACAVVSLWLTGDIYADSGSSFGWASLAYLTIVGSVVVFVSWNRMILVNPLVQVASLHFLLPMFGSLSSLVILGERLSPQFVAGGAMILVGIWLSGAAVVTLRRTRR